MRSVVVILGLWACGSSNGNSAMTPLDGPYECVDKLCAPGQVCVVSSSGNQCWVNPDAGIGQYQPVEWDCVDMPAECNGTLSCDCLSCEGSCFGATDRTLDCGCI
jgi:hypothetical protein